ncbi:patatin-like phospholipase family protein [Longispora albida]|uniref:patatin-like phospholipase family protein n=1 Tax=Longispora albida TaxID=203523 RepID=UPI00036A0D64|nr:patatin-like phospholipase family protein [Longispora albida]
MELSHTADAPKVAFVLGGGGYLGGYQAGMLRALLERGIRPDLVIGTSAGSIQGAILAADPTVAVAARLATFWTDCVTTGVMRIRPREAAASVLRLRAALARQDRLRTLLERYLGAGTRIEDLAVPYQACAASIERATARYFDSGPLIPALLASCAVPGLWPPVPIGGEHYVDGGVVETIPIGRAAAYQPQDIYVLRLRQRQQPLRLPRWPWQLGNVIFEVARRHRLGQVIHARPDGIRVHLMPTGEELLEPPDHGLRTSVAEQVATIARRVEQGYRSACAYLDNDSEQTGTHPSSAARRATPDGPARPAPRPTSAFLSAKLHRHFELFDHDDDDLITAADYRAVADHIASAFGHAPEGAVANRLRASFTAWWIALCQAAGQNGHNGIGRPAFDRALFALASDPDAYDGYLYPAIDAVLAAADTDGDRLLNHTEAVRMLRAFGVPPAQARTAALRLDTNGDGVLALDELAEAFHDYYTSDEPARPGNLLFGP